jgi:hypothetical protein
MRQRHLARPGVEAAADQRRHRSGMVGRSERAAVRQGAVGEVAGNGLDHGDFEELRY